MDPASYNLHPLPIPVPPVLFEALGYPGEQRFFTMRWSEASEYHPVLLDYWDGFYGQSRPQDAYLLYTSHPRVAPLLADYELGADPDSATHLLVFDRTERVAWIGTVMDVHHFLKEQWPQMSQEEVNAIAFSVFDKLMTSALQDAELSFQERAEERRPQAEEAQQRRATLLSELQRALDEAAIPARPGPPESSEQP